MRDILENKHLTLFEQNKWTTIPSRGEVQKRINELLKSSTGQMLIQEIRELRNARVRNNAIESVEKWINSTS